MSKEDIRTRIEGGVLEVIVDRPKANAIDRATSTAMGELFIDYRDNPDLRCAIITGRLTKNGSRMMNVRA